MASNFYRAQRLSASEIRHSHIHNFSTRLQCAQRLSASEIRHVRCCLSIWYQKHSCSTPFGIRDSTRLGLSRNKHLNIWCSTPFGIRDSTHPKTGELRRIHHVLNAFRHQRFDTVWNKLHSFQTVRCSTPFGIRDSTRIFRDFCH